ncbi:hypothetical protein [Bradyrhizobium sp.]|jgi:molybdopterin synthase catalytic subunit|uniref:hypothetical protein n=1 Tax=Bradyrhizobium sp. TaxID=376 RepID=UPI003C1DD857
MALGALASIFAAARCFLGVRASDTTLAALDAFCVLPGRIRNVDDETQLRQIEHEIDGILRDQLARTASREEAASEAQALIAAAHRLDNLIHHRRTLIAARAAKPLALGSEAECKNQTCKNRGGQWNK